MQVPNYVLRARRLNAPPDLISPPSPPASLADVERDAWVLAGYVRKAKSRSFLGGIGAGAAAVLVAAVALHASRPTAHAAPRKQVALSFPAQVSHRVVVGSAAPVAPSPVPAAFAVSTHPDASPAPSLAPASTQPKSAAPVEWSAPPVLPAPPPAVVAAVTQPSAPAHAEKREKPHHRQPKRHHHAVRHHRRTMKRVATPSERDSSRSTVLYSAVAPAQAAPAARRSANVASPPVRPIDWSLVGTPAAGYALIAVSGRGGQDVRPVQIGQALPNGATLLSVQPDLGQIITSQGRFSVPH